VNYLLDTNICSYIIRQKPQVVLQKFQALAAGDVAVSAITVAELQYGVAKSQQPERNQIALYQFLAPLVILPFTEETAVFYGNLRAQLEKNGSPIGALDTLIAAHALAERLILITNNQREFARVPGLQVENWVDETT
jgi:tRNA(fMet)-specific endonuclease VapC